jgi:hypothetical protein
MNAKGSIGMNHENKITQGKSVAWRPRQTVVLLATALSLVAMSLPLWVRAEAGARDSQRQTEELAGQLTENFFLAQQQPPTLACDETKQGSIDQSDRTFSDGTHFDQYNFTTQQPNQPFIITLRGAANYAPTSELFFFDPQQQRFVFLQGGYSAPNKQVQHMGVLATPGQYAIVVFPIDNPQQGLGPYTIKLECKSCGSTEPGPGGCSGGNSVQAAVQLQYDQQTSCELSANDAQIQDQQGGTHFAKIYTFQAQAGSTRVEVSAQAFTPLVGVLDPNTGRLTNVNSSPNSLNLPTGPAYIVVTSNETQRTGAFTIKITRGGGGPF